MGDPLSVGASIIAVLHLAGAVVKFLSDANNASTTCNGILSEVSCSTGLLCVIRNMLEDASGEECSIIAASLKAPNGPLAQFESALTQIKNRLEPVAGVKNARGAIFWPFKKEEVAALLATMERQKTLFTLIIQNNHMELSRALRDDIKYVRQGVNQIHATVTQLQIKQQLVESTGAGKTVLTSVIINFLEELFGKDAAVAYFYCSYKERNHTALNLTASLLQQLVQRRPTVSEDIVSLYIKHARKQTHPSLDEFFNLLQSEVRRFSEVFVVIDALDECPEQEVEILLPKLRELLPDVHLLVTSRHVKHIIHEFEQAARLEIHASDEDVRTYTEARLAEEKQLIRHIKGDPILQNTIVESIVNKANGMFLVAQLHLDSLTREDNRRDVRRSLQNLPTELNEIYNEAMERIQAQDDRKAKRAKQVLSWIFRAVRPLTVREIQHALAVETGDQELVEDALPDEDVLISACSGLVVINQKSDIMHLVHYTAQEYLERMHLVLFPDADAEIAKTCLTYLSFDTFAEGCYQNDDEVEQRLQKNPLLSYTASYWGHHVRGDPENDPTIRGSIQKFLGQEQNILCSTQVRCVLPYRFKGYTQQFPKSVSALHVAASFGLRNFAKILIESGVNIKARDTLGNTPLHSAASNGFQDVVELLLQSGADVGAKNHNGMRALHWAALEGHLPVIHILLQKHQDINAITNVGETALYYAALKGYSAVVALLLERGADHDLRETVNGQTPLSKAAWEGHEAAVKLLLEYGADPEAADSVFGQTSLALAAENGKERVVRLLLSKSGVDKNAKDHDGRTPLFHAARLGREAVARLLLERNDVDPNVVDHRGWTPLLQAEQKGHDVVYQLISATISGESTKQPYPQLLKAVDSGDEQAVRVLLDRDGTDPNFRSSEGDTSLLLAAKKGTTRIVQLLLEHDGVDLEAKCSFGRTPLSWAAGKGHVTIVQLLLRRGVDLNPRSKGGRTPLAWALAGGRTAVVNLLLEEEGIEVNSREDEWGETPLMAAVEFCNEAIVRRLLEKGSNVEESDNSGRMPLTIAIWFGRDRIAELLKSKILRYRAVNSV